MSAHQEDQGSPTKAVLATVVVGFVAIAIAVATYSYAVQFLKEHHAGNAAIIAASLTYGAVILAIAAGLARIGQKLMRRTPTTAAKRYARRFFTAMSAYVVLLVLAIGAFIQLQPTGLLAYALAVAPALPLVAAIAVIGIYLREETDEFERAILAESALWATAGLLATASVWGFLELFHLVQHAESWIAFPLWAMFFGPAQILARRRYR